MTAFGELIVGRVEVLTACSDANPNFDVVLIPGLGTAPGSEWAICQPQWLSILNKDGKRLRFLEYRYSVPIDENTSGSIFFDQSANLLPALARFRADVEVQKRPLLLVCHSLGGCLLKQALCTADAQQPGSNLLLSSIVGIIFLGTPHNDPKDRTWGERCLWILRAASGLSSNQLKGPNKAVASILSNLAARFSDSIFNVGLEILTVYEEKSTDLSTGEKVILVDRNLARTGALRELCVGLPLSHFGLCKLSDELGEPDVHVRSWLETFLRYSIMRVESRLISYHHRTSIGLVSDKGVSRKVADYALARKEGSAEAENTGEGRYDSSTLDSEVNSMIEALTPTRKKAVLPCISLGGYPRNQDFTGRSDELNFLDSVLLHHKTI